MRHILLAACMSISIDTLAHAQSPTRTAERQQALYEAHKGDFDYLLGDWEFTDNKEYGKGRGNIQKDRFSWTADRSVDGGKTWEKNYQQLEARRIGPPRALGPLAGRK